MNFSGLSGRGGGARKLKQGLFLFSGTVFFGAIEKQGGWLGSIEFLEGRDGQIVCEVKKRTIDLYLICLRIEDLRLGEALECERS